MTTENDDHYNSYYREHDIKVYPNEFVIRSFLGKYPKHRMDKAALKGQSILDLGFGDGRNMPLLADLGMKIHGVEVTQGICDEIATRMAKRGVEVDARVGRNADIPYDNAAFDNLLACSSCYYIDPGQTYTDNLTEIARVIKPGGYFIHCLPMLTSFILLNAKPLDSDGHLEVTQDPYGVRVGQKMRGFADEADIEKTLSPLFTDIQIGSTKADYWGEPVHLWLVSCRKK